MGSVPLAGLSLDRAAIARAPGRSLTFDASAAQFLLEGVTKSDNVAEAVVLATCERIEIYIVALRFHGAMADVRDALARVLQIDVAELGACLVDRHDDGVVNHLFRVAAGLDSAVIGETEVLGQIARAWDAARKEGAARSTLNALFRAAIVAGKRARSETHIADGVRTIGSATAHLVERHTDELASKSVVVVGTGEAARSAAFALNRLAPAKLSIVSRSAERAEALAAELDATPLVVSDLPVAIGGADVVVTATSAGKPVVTSEMIGNRPMVVVDLGEPPDVDRAVDGLPLVTLEGLDAVRHVMDESHSRRSEDVGAVEAIVENEVARFLTDQRERSMDPLIVDLRDSAERQRAAELNRFSARLATLDEDQRKAVEELTAALTAKFVHAPTVNLKSAAGTTDGERLAEAARRMFGV